MTTAYTSLLGLALPVTGELSGTWGDTVNNGITSLLDSAISGTTTLSADSDVTLTTTQGSSNTAREAILLWTAGGSATRTITAPAQSKIYTVINASSGTQSIILAGAGPTTGVTIAKGESALCAWNGSDFIKISNTAGPGTFTNLTVTGNTSLGDADTDTITQAASYVTGTQLKSAKTATNTLSLAAYDVDGTAYTNLITLTASNTPTLALTSTGVGTINNMSIGATTASTGSFTTLSANSTVTLSGGTINGVAYLNGTNVLTTGSALTFDGTNLGVGGSSSYKLGVTGSSNNATSGAIQTVNSNVGTSTQTGLWASNGTQTAQFSLAGTGYTAYGAYAAGNAIIYNDQAITLMADNASTGVIKFAAGGNTEGMRLTSTSLYTASGINVGIGTSLPSAKLHIYKSSLPAELRIQSGDTQPTISFYSDAVQTPTRNWAISSSFAAYGDLCFLQSTALGGNPITAGTTRMTLNASGNLQASGTISVGNATPSTSGAGITFPATQSASSDANTLDDYEEGSFTPSVSATGVTAYSIRNGKYTKIGQVVVLNIQIQVQTSSGGTGGFIISNAPFMQSSYQATASARESGLGTGFLNSVWMESNSTNIYIDGAQLSASYGYAFTIVYQV